MKLGAVLLWGLLLALGLNAQTTDIKSAAAELQKITLEPQAGFIAGVGNMHSFIVTGHYRDGSIRDLTRDAIYLISDNSVVAGAAKGSFNAVGEGVAKVTAVIGSKTADAAIIVSPAGHKSWEFATDIAPIFSK